MIIVVIGGNQNNYIRANIMNYRNSQYVSQQPPSFPQLPHKSEPKFRDYTLVVMLNCESAGEQMSQHSFIIIVSNNYLGNDRLPIMIINKCYLYKIFPIECK